MKYAVKAHFANWGPVDTMLQQCIFWLHGYCKSAHYFCHQKKHISVIVRHCTQTICIVSCPMKQRMF